MAYTANIEDGVQVVDYQKMGGMMKEMGMMSQKGMVKGDHMGWSGQKTSFGGVHAAMAVVTWLLVIALLLAMIRYFWKKSE